MIERKRILLCVRAHFFFSLLILNGAVYLLFSGHFHYNRNAMQNTHIKNLNNNKNSSQQSSINSLLLWAGMLLCCAHTCCVCKHFYEIIF